MATNSTATANNNGFATREQLLSKCKRRHIVVTLPVSGYEVRCQSLMENEVANFRREIVNTKTGAVSLTKTTRLLIRLCVVDANGHRMFTPSDDKLIGENWDGADSAYLCDRLMSHCGIDQDDVDVLVKNSDRITVD